MKITYEQRGSYYYIENNGRVIGQYNNISAFYEGQTILLNLRGQLARPEAFCDCKSQQETRS